MDKSNALEIINELWKEDKIDEKFYNQLNNAIDRKDSEENTNEMVELILIAFYTNYNDIINYVDDFLNKNIKNVERYLNTSEKTIKRNFQQDKLTFSVLKVYVEIQYLSSKSKI